MRRRRRPEVRKRCSARKSGRMVDRCEHRVTDGLLASFVGVGLTWRDILELDNHGAACWRDAIMDAEARGLLWWDLLLKRWRVTEEGRGQILDVA